MIRMRDGKSQHRSAEILSMLNLDDEPGQSNRNMVLAAADLWAVLERVKDPEIPVISVVEMGIVRDVILDETEVTDKITPTFSGCPAIEVIKCDIKNAIQDLGLNVSVETAIHPAWSSDWISDSGRQKLKDFGLSPPPRHGGRLALTFFELVQCPYCDSHNSSVKNTFGPTLCRAIYYCNDCQQPFEQLKPL